MAGASAAEEKITVALNKELEVVEKECMRPMQVSPSTRMYYSSQNVSVMCVLVLRGRPFCVVPSAVRTSTVHRKYFRDVYSLA